VHGGRGAVTGAAGVVVLCPSWRRAAGEVDIRTASARAIRNGSPMIESADRPADQLVAGLYDELRALAHAHLRRERPGHTLQTTALVNEAYLRLAGQTALSPADRTRFFGAASNTMRRVLVDHARRRARLKRGAGDVCVAFDEAGDALLTEREADEMLALDDALERLAGVSPRGSLVVQHRFFGGLTLDETAEVLGVSAKTVQRDWLVARAWLRKEIAGELGVLDPDR
jgi:RNA polymerase sigma factor (TIGR02999 family)